MWVLIPTKNFLKTIDIIRFIVYNNSNKETDSFGDTAIGTLLSHARHRTGV